MEVESTIRILCGNKEFVLQKKLLKISKYFLTVLECDPSLTEIKVPSISSDTFEKIIPYLVHRNGKEGEKIERPIKEKTIEKNYNDPWVIEYINKMSETELLDLLHTSNYLDIKCLIALCACKLATIIGSLSIEKAKDYITKIQQ